MRHLPVFLILLGLVAQYTFFEFGRLGANYGKLKTLDGTTFYTPSQAKKIIAQMQQHRATYLEQETTIDMVFPLLYAAMFAVAIIALAAPAKAPWALVLLPLIAAAADYAENLTVIRIMSRNATDPGGLATVASIASAAKGVFILASFATVAVLAVMAYVRR
jgi:hypothetical protein